MTRKAAPITIGELDMLTIEQAMAYTHTGEKEFKQTYVPFIDTYTNTIEQKKNSLLLYDKKQLYRRQKQLKLRKAYEH